MATTTIFLPFPPSVNGLFKNVKGRGRVKTPKYIAWQKEALIELNAHKFVNGFKWKNHTGQVKISLLLKAPDKRKRDLDNIFKSVLDFLVLKEVIKADDQTIVRELFAQWKDDMPMSGCFVIIQDIDL